MSNFANSIDLSKLPGAKIVKLADEKGVARPYACIPLDEGYTVTGEKGIYMNLLQLETKEQRFGQTHFFKPSYSKEANDKMSEEQKRSIPIVGNSRLVDFSKHNTAVENAQTGQPVQEAQPQPAPQQQADTTGLPF